MTGKNSRAVLSSLVLSLILLGLNFRIAQGRVDTSENLADGSIESTLEPRYVKPTPTPSEPLNLQSIADNPSEPTRITDNQCCPYPQWSSDSEWILFIDSTGKDGPGLYSVPVEGGPPTFLTSQVGSYSEDLSLVAYPEAGLVYIERWAIGDRWLVPSQGREVYLSHENEWIAWEYGSTSIQHQDLKQRTIWIANIKGEQARELITVHGGKFLGWIDHGRAILVSGRLSPLSPSGIWRVDRESGAAQLLFGTERARDVSISPEGEWIAFTVAFQTNATENGLWVLRTDGSSVTRLMHYGSYRWRSEGQLLLIPYDFSSPEPYLWQISVEEERIFALTDPEEIRLPIANNDWQISPDGSKIVFYSMDDLNLWVMDLPKTP
ncbi:MAG: hypothetical protein PVG02_02240 [Anaerolineales bacterium]|jgi:hypothetical protein